MTIAEDAKLARKPVKISIQGTKICAAWWEIEAHVEMRPFDEGGLLYSVVLRFTQNDDSGDRGMSGKLETPYLYSVAEAARQASRLAGMVLHSFAIDEATDEYVIETCEITPEALAQIIECACRVTTVGVREEAKQLAYDAEEPDEPEASAESPF